MYEHFLREVSMGRPEEIDFGGNLNRLVEKIDSIESGNKEILRELEKMKVSGWESWNKGLILAFLGAFVVPSAGVAGAGVHMLLSKDDHGIILVGLGFATILFWGLWAWFMVREISRSKRKTNPK
jgi:hypothetical protein